MGICDASPDTMFCNDGNQKLPYIIGIDLKPGSCEVISQSEPSIEWIPFGENLDDGPSTIFGALQLRFEGYKTGAIYLRLLCGT